MARFARNGNYNVMLGVEYQTTSIGGSFTPDFGYKRRATTATKCLSHDSNEVSFT